MPLKKKAWQYKINSVYNTMLICQITYQSEYFTVKRNQWFERLVKFKSLHPSSKVQILLRKETKDFKR